ncbi:winged helix-turn-helix transcriptional regulator [Candidatus Bathyarchaeota archaeon]|nr:winged helix-turn-helix transcriptional regulator [Candidatus Bathyarchaeota archaeon]
MRVKELLNSLVKEKGPGPALTFTSLHLIKVLELIAEGPIGRGKLAKKLGIGEGTIRTIIKRLKDSNLIEISKNGCHLTNFGKDFWKKFKEKIPKKVFLEKNEFSLAEYTVAVLIKKCGDKVRIGMQQRDAAIMAGAEGATTLVVKDRKIILPGVSDDVAKDYPVAYRQIVELLKPEHDDVVVVGTGETKEKAEYGALAAALTLLED